MLPVSVLLRNRPPPHVLHPDVSILDAAKFFRDHKFGGAPVLDGAKLVGFCSERDIVHRVIAEGRDPAAATVADVMSKKVTTATIDCTIEECEKKMRRAHVRHLPILDHGTLVGCISLREVLRSELEEKELDVRCLDEYVRGTSCG
jgi:CBS domain-containing protein